MIYINLVFYHAKISFHLYLCIIDVINFIMSDLKFLFFSLKLKTYCKFELLFADI